jgi:hypothetical protein
MASLGISGVNRLSSMLMSGACSELELDDDEDDCGDALASTML